MRVLFSKRLTRHFCSGKATLETTIEAGGLGDPYMANPGKKIFPSAKNFAGVDGTAYLEIYCGNAKQAAHYYQHSFGFEPFAYKGLETGSKDKVSYALRQNDIRLILTSALRPSNDIGSFLDKHGDGVKFIALSCKDANHAHAATVQNGAKSFLNPTVSEDTNGRVVTSGIHAYGDVVHLFVEKGAYKGDFLPGFVPLKSSAPSKDCGLRYIDHMVGNVDWKEMDVWAKYYKDVFGMEQLISFDDKDISTDYTALKSKVMTIETGLVKYPINEPAKGLKKSQIEEFIEFNTGAGVQHVAVATEDIIKTVSDMRRRGVEFLRVPDEYYAKLSERVGVIKEDVQVLKELGILADRDDKGYLLQIFTKPLTDRPTLFFEIIQRRGGYSFGKGNFKALFVSIEEEQAKRGTL